ncbi:MAG TPA: hypothetical protein VFR37_25350 [Longimicrobium sp.]|nr:hypothetical protein [Longimicrobium sp.]
MMNAARLKRAELTSAVGALVLGTGLGALFARYLAPAALAVLVAGLLLHAWGMYDKHRLERGSEAASVRYATALYRLCWGLLALLAAYLAARALG